eukprot:2443086-Ditylum_brightwellii.AAC.3
MGLMWPRSFVLNHLAAGPAAKKALQAETHEKVSQGYAKLVCWGGIKDNIPKKISPAACIPHKSRVFWIILDLSFNIQENSITWPFVNDTTNKQVKPEAMYQLGTLLKCLCTQMMHGTFVTSSHRKVMWPWMRLSLLFYTACKWTGVKAPLSSAPHQKLMLKRILPEITPSQALTLLEVFVHDFIAAINDTSRANLQWLSHTMMHGIHAIFPPPEVSGHARHDPISESKIDKGEGVWEYAKETLG